MPNHKTDWLPPRNIELQQHPYRRYVNLETGRPYPVSITSLIGAVTLTDSAKLNIERYRETWEPRGNAVHSALETYLKTGIRADDSDPYIEWINPMLDLKLWQEVVVVASELIVADDEQDWAGTLDLAVRWPDGSYGVLDAKSKGSASSNKQDVRPQLGAATRALNDTYGIYCSRNAVLWVYPGRTSLQAFTGDECLQAWADTYDHYCLQCRGF